MRTTGLTLLAASAALALTACSKKAPEDIPPPPVSTTPAPTPMPTPTPSGPTPGSQADFLANTTADRIFFDLDQSNIDAEDEATLRSQAAWLLKYPSRRITIEGHCDERGTREYNLALGDRRANAAKNFLASLGVDPSRMTTISYGKERPAALGSDEVSWAQNRRAVTIVLQ